MKTKKFSLISIMLVFAMVLMACSYTLNLPDLSKLSEQIQATVTSVPQVDPTSEAPKANSGANAPAPTALPAAPETAISGAGADLQAQLQTVYKNALPGIVMIRFTTSDGSQGEGTGFVIDKEGHIVTNYHVAGDVTDMEVDFADGLKVEGKTIGRDMDSDLAVVKVEVPADKLFPLSLGDSDQAPVGTVVVAIGSPYGLGGTMTMGIISAHGRTLDSLRQSDPNDPTGQSGYFAAGDLIQTDTSINPGNSGGPLLNLQGQVIGVNRAIQTAGTSMTGEAVNTGIGFAISSNMVRRVVPSLISNGSYDYPYLGMTALSDMSLSAAKQLGLNVASGAYITGLVDGGPAQKAGLIAGRQATNRYGMAIAGPGGDLIVGVDGKPVLQFADLLTYMLLNKTPGDTMTFTIVRGGKQMDVKVTLGARP